MPSQLLHHEHEEKIARVVQYIYSELSKAQPDSLTVDKLSQVAGFSKYHFHRVFCSYTGKNVTAFVLMVKLKRASYQLAFQHEMKVIDIAYDAGFENPESFSRAFSREFNQTPSQFRKQPEWMDLSDKVKYEIKFTGKSLNKDKGAHHMTTVEICHMETVKVAALEHHGSPKKLNHTVAQFIAWRKQSAESPIATTQTYGIAYSDPDAVPANEFRFDVCSSVQVDIKDNDFEVVNKTIPGGRCAKVTHLGSHDLMDEKIRFLYGQWLTESGEKLRDFPVFFHYKNLFPQVAEHDLITDIYLPLA